MSRTVPFTAWRLAGVARLVGVEPGAHETIFQSR
jgi:hypothetical protein